MKYVDADKIKYTNFQYGIVPTSVLTNIAFKEDIDKLPAADVVPVVHAHWIYPYKNNCRYADIAQCSNCGSYFQDKINVVSFCYKCCPVCKAMMDEKEDEE